MLQNATEGGDIEAVPNALGNEQLISNVLEGNYNPGSDSTFFRYKPGDLVLFNGTTCLHRVTQCAGPDSRGECAFYFHR